VTIGRGHRPRAAVAYVCACSVAASLAAGCSAPSAATPHLAVDWTPRPAVGIDSLADLRVTGGDRQPILGVRLQVDAFMSHPGMAPVAADVQEQGNGVYRARLRFTMAGDWVMRVHGVLPDGRAFELLDDVGDVRPPG